MFDFFTWIWDMFVAMVNFLIEIIEGMLRLFSLIPVGVSALYNSVSYLPSFLASFAFATITISVIFILVGRETGGQK